jgi:membrane protein DedA with SNARE-associated domain
MTPHALAITLFAVFVVGCYAGYVYGRLFGSERVEGVSA